MEEKILPDRLESERLILRRPEKGDAADFYAYAGGDRVGPMAGWQPHRSIRDTKQIIAHYVKEGNVLAITTKETGRMVGTVGLHVDDHRPGTDVWQLGYALSPAHWHEGIAGEAALTVLRYAFERKWMRIVTAYCYPENTASRKLLERLGFRHEGCLRNSYLLYDGTVHDLDCFSITVEEYSDRYY